MKTTLTIGMAVTTSNVEPMRTMSLRVTDKPSGMLLFDVNLTAEQYLQIQNGQVHVEVTVPDAEQWARFGKRMEHRSVIVPPEVYRSAGSRLERAALAESWALGQAEADEQAEIRHTNSGIAGIFRKWVDQ